MPLVASHGFRDTTVAIAETAIQKSRLGDALVIVLDFVGGKAFAESVNNIPAANALRLIGNRTDTTVKTSNPSHQVWTHS